MFVNDFFDSDCPRNYLYNLIVDYENYMKDYGFIPLDDFILKWNCLLLDDFDKLKPGDIVYDCVGNKLTITDYPYVGDNDIDHYVEADNGDIYNAGDLYKKDYSSALMDYKKKICEGEKATCPILITKTKQHQN